MSRHKLFRILFFLVNNHGFLIRAGGPSSNHRNDSSPKTHLQLQKLLMDKWKRPRSLSNPTTGRMSTRGIRDKPPREKTQVQNTQGRINLPSLASQNGSNRHMRDEAAAPEMILPDTDPFLLDPLRENGNDEEGESVHFVNPSYQSSQFEFEEVTIGVGEEQQGESDIQNIGGIGRDYLGMDLALAGFPECVLAPSLNFTETVTADVSGSSDEFEDSVGVDKSIQGRFHPVVMNGGAILPGLGELSPSGEPPSDPYAARTFVCELCPKRFVRSRDREIHTNSVHHNPNSQVCSFCGEYYRDERSLTRHVNIAHFKEKPKSQPIAVKENRCTNNTSHSHSVSLRRPSTACRSISGAVQCQYCDMNFESVMGRRKHELIHFQIREDGAGENREDPIGASESNASLYQVDQEQSGQVVYEVDGNSNPENVLLPMGMMMKTDVEVPMPIGSVKGENQEDEERSTSETPAYIPESFDEFIALL